MVRWRVGLALCGLLVVAPAASAAWAFSGGGGRAGAAGVASARGDRHAVASVKDGRHVSRPEATYRWHGLTVPVGACGAMVGGRPWVLACTDERVAVYRRHVARRRAWDAAVVAGAAVLGAAIAAGVGSRHRCPAGFGAEGAVRHRG